MNVGQDHHIGNAAIHDTDHRSR